MLTSILSSRTLWHRLNSVKPALLTIYYTLISSRNHIKLRLDYPLRLYHSITQVQKKSEFPIPREDYTLNQDVAKANYTITMLCREGKISEAREMFEVMPERDVISWTALISGYIKSGLVEVARELFDRVDAKKNVVTWTTMISGYLKTKRICEAEKLFDEMPDSNMVAWNTMIHGLQHIVTLSTTEAENPVFHDRTKHIDVRRHFIRDIVEKGIIYLKKIPSQANPSDMGTK
ncbi:hypothetical protein OROGR_006603 [Orobanche gracilis]